MGVSGTRGDMREDDLLHLSGLELEVKPVSTLEWLCAGFCFCSSAWHIHVSVWWIFRILLWSDNRAVLWPQLAGNLMGKTDDLRCNVLTEKFMKLTLGVLAVLWMFIYMYIHLFIYQYHDKSKNFPSMLNILWCVLLFSTTSPAPSTVLSPITMDCLVTLKFSGDC